MRDHTTTAEQGRQAEGVEASLRPLQTTRGPSVFPVSLFLLWCEKVAVGDAAIDLPVPKVPCVSAMHTAGVEVTVELEFPVANASHAVPCDLSPRCHLITCALTLVVPATV